MTSTDAPPLACGTSARTAPSPSVRRLASAAAPLLVLELALWCALLAGGLFRAGPNGRSLGVDFAVFVSAAQVLAHGGNPYDNHLLFRTEHAFLGRQGLAAPTQVGLVRAGNPPLFYWALEPFTRLPFREAALLWIALMFGLAALGFLACLQYLGWTRRALPLVFFLLMPQVALGACYGNIHAVVFAALSGSLALLRRHPRLAGLLLGAGWLKPQLVFPLVLLILLFHPACRKQLVAGLAIVSGALLCLTVLVLGSHSVVQWLAGLTSWSHDVGLEPNIASVAGLYVGWVPYRFGLLLAVLLFLLAGGVTARAWWPHRHEASPTLTSAWLWVVWFLASPFAHFPDEILLTIPVLALVGHNGLDFHLRGSLLAVYTLFFSVALFSLTIWHINLLSLTILVVGTCLYRSHDRGALPEICAAPTGACV